MFERQEWWAGDTPACPHEPWRRVYLSSVYAKPQASHASPVVDRRLCDELRHINHGDIQRARNAAMPGIHLDLVVI